MKNPRLAARYAKSLLDLAIEQSSLDSTLADMQLLDDSCRVSPELCTVLRSPVIKADKKNSIINAVVGNKMHKLTLGFLTLLVNKGREDVLPEISKAFIEQYNLMKGISKVKLTTAAPITDTVKESIRAKVATSMPGQSIEMETAIDPALIGGFKLEMGDKLIDASVLRDLRDVKKQFTENLYVPAI